MEHVIALATDQRVYERDAIPKSSKKGQSLRHMRENMIPQFFAYQQANAGPDANTLEFYQQQMPNDPFGFLFSIFVHWVFFER
jgi:hypothetical protein